VIGQVVKCRFGRLVFTLGYDYGYTLSGWKSGSGLYQEGPIFRSHLEALAERVPFLLMFGGNLCSNGALGSGQNTLYWGWSGKWYLGVCL